MKGRSAQPRLALGKKKQFERDQQRSSIRLCGETDEETLIGETTCEEESEQGGGREGGENAGNEEHPRPNPKDDSVHTEPQVLLLSEPRTLDSLMKVLCVCITCITCIQHLVPSSNSKQCSG